MDAKRLSATNSRDQVTIGHRIMGVVEVLCAIAPVSLMPLRAQAQANLLVDLGVATGYGVNNSGQVALSTGIYSNGVVTPLGALSGLTVDAVPAAINESGQIAGNEVNAGLSPCGAANFPPPSIPVLYSNGLLTSLPMPSCQPLTPGVVVAGINAFGQVVGWGKFGMGDEIFDVVIYTNGVPTIVAPPTSQFGVPAGSINSQAYAINDSGVVTGTAVNTLPIQVENDAFIYNNGVWTNLGPGAGYAINASGQVVGFLDVNGHSDAFIYTAGTLIDIGVGTAYAINTTGQVVGVTAGSGSLGSAFFYNGSMTDMNVLVSASDPLKPFVTLTGAAGINDNRFVLANGVDSRDSSKHAYLLQVPWLNIAPGVLPFPSEAIGSVSAGQAVTITNAGTTAIPIDSVTASGDFTIQQNNCGASLAAGGDCNVTVAFVPTASGERTGVLTIVSNALPFTVALSGVSPISATISASPTSVITGTPTKLTYMISLGTSCTATGGTAADGWTGAIVASGSKSVTETVAGMYTYGLDCIAGSQTAQPQTNVTVSSAPSGSGGGGGGGAFDVLSLLGLFGLFGLRGMRFI